MKQDIKYEEPLLILTPKEVAKRFGTTIDAITDLERGDSKFPKRHPICKHGWLNKDIEKYLIDNSVSGQSFDDIL